MVSMSVHVGTPSRHPLGILAGCDNVMDPVEMYTPRPHNTQEDYGALSELCRLLGLRHPEP